MASTPTGSILLMLTSTDPVSYTHLDVYKRQLPDGPKVGSVSLSPRGDWRMPSDAAAALWLQELDCLQ